MAVFLSAHLSLHHKDVAASPILIVVHCVMSVQTRLTGFSNVSNIWKPTATKKVGQQRKLSDLQKVVSIKGGAVNFDISELLEARELLEAEDTPVAAILDSLRRLSCFDITREMLLSTKIGPAVRKLKKHPNPEVARISAALVEKWKGVVTKRMTQQGASKRL